jgi:hypothetical protein
MKAFLSSLEGVLELAGIKPYQSRGSPVRIGNKYVGEWFQGVDESFLTAACPFGDTSELSLVSGKKGDQPI